MEESSVAVRSQEEKCYTIIFWVILLFSIYHIIAKTTSPPLFNFTLLKRKKGIFCDLRRCCNFTEESFIANHPRAWSPIQIKKKKAFSWFEAPCTYLFSYHQTCLRILQGHEGIYFLIILSQQTQECLYGVQRKRPRTNTAGEGEIKNLLITANSISL